MGKRIVESQTLEAASPMDEELIEVTLLDLEQPAHMWPKEQLRIIGEARNVGNLALILTVVRDEPIEGQSSLARIEQQPDGTYMLEELYQDA